MDDGRKTLEIDWESQIVIEKGNNIYVFTYDRPAWADWDSMANQILSTFEFASPIGGDQNKIIDTSNWKTYTNTKYKYSIKYPTNWAVKNFGQLDQKTIELVAFNPNAVQNELSAAITIAITSRTYQQELELGVEKSEPIIVDNVQGAKKIEGSPDGSSSIRVIIPLGQNTLSIGTKREFEELFDQILSTFEFD